MSEKDVPFEAPRPEDQFAGLTDSIKKIMDWHPDYFTSERITEIFKELDDAKKRLETGELAPPKGITRINIYTGKNADVISEFYAFFSALTGQSAADYKDLQAEIRELYDNKQVFVEGTSFISESSFRELERGDKLALSDGRDPTGLQLKMSGNIYTLFRLGDLDDPKNIAQKDSYVDVLVADIEG